MNDKLLQLATRQGVLKARIEAQRCTLAEQAVPLESALARGDAVLEGVDWLQPPPGALGGAGLAVEGRGCRAGDHPGHSRSVECAGKAHEQVSGGRHGAPPDAASARAARSEP